MEASRLDELRQGIDQIDSEIISLLARRFQLTEEVGLFKAVHHLNAQDNRRESQQFEKITKLSNSHGLNSDYAAVLYRCLMDIVISRHQEIQQSKQEQEITV
jgi:chorismate mutase